MGQGSYYAVGYGVLFDEGQLDQERCESALYASHKRCKASGMAGNAVRSAYESRTPYLAILVAGGPSRDSPGTQPLCVIAPTLDAKAEWERFAAEAGVTRAPQLLWIADYD